LARMSTKGFGELGKTLKGIGKRTARPKLALEAIGRSTVNKHITYFSKAGNAGRGGGPPKAQWPGLEASTIKAKSKRRKTKKLVNTGLLKAGFEHRVTGNKVEIFNREAIKQGQLQVQGVGKKKKKFIIVATQIGKHDPKQAKLNDEIMADFLLSGKVKR